MEWLLSEKKLIRQDTVLWKPIEQVCDRCYLKL